MHLTYLDSNSWLIDFEHTRILLDPWLMGDLVFAGADWFFRGFREQSRALPESIDLILLSQGLEDHAHPETLKQLDHTIPVVASPTAAKVVKRLGYSQVTTLPHGAMFTWENRLTIQAFPGAPIGPLLTENAYLLTDLARSTRLYYEPHGYHAPALQQESPVDIVITPLLNLELPWVGAFIKGQESALSLAQWLHPRVILPTAAGGDVKFDGLLTSLLRATGSLEAFQTQLQAHGLSTQVLEPVPGDRFEVVFDPIAGEAV